MILSIGMIVKNESKYLGKCLDGLKPILKEIDSELIIVDTGSTDNTIEIAKRYTNQVFERKWENDFAKMRNLTVEYSSGQWFMFIDADEIIENPKVLISFFKTRDDEKYNTGCFLIKNMANEEGEIFSTSNLPRLFRRTEHFKFENAIHEQPKYIRPVVNISMNITHYGYMNTDKRLMERKFKRNTGILMQELQKAPDNIYYLHQLCKSYFAHEDYVKAIEQALLAYDIMHKNNLDKYSVIYIYIDLIQLYIAIKDYNKAKELCREAIEIENDNLDITFYFACAQFGLEEYEQALTNYLKYLDLLEKYETGAVTAQVGVAINTLSNKDYALLKIASIYEKSGCYEQVVLNLERIKTSKLLQKALPGIIQYCLLLGRHKHLSDYYNNILMNYPELAKEFDELLKNQCIKIKNSEAEQLKLEKKLNKGGKPMSNDMILYQKKLQENINLLINQNRLDEAKEIINQYESIVKDDLAIYSTKAVIAMMEGNTEEAEQILIKGLAMDNENFDLLYNLAYLYQSYNRIESAIKYYKIAFWNAKTEEDSNSVYELLQQLGVKESKEDLLKNKASNISIVILTYNNLEYNKLCIESIRKYTEKGTYEIIIVDNHSTDGTVEWLKQQNDLKLVLNDDNLGFPKGCNQGIEIADKNNDILLLNNDTIVTPCWLDNLKKCLYSDEKIGAVGSVTNSCSNYQVIRSKYSNIQEMINFAKCNNISNPSQWEERLRLVGFCMLIKAEVIRKVGLLDEIFTPGNFEDDDYSFRIRKAGYKLMLCKDSFIHHFGSASFRKEANKYNDLLVINREKFIKKWGVDPYSIAHSNDDTNNPAKTADKQHTARKSFKDANVDAFSNEYSMDISPLVSILIPTYNRPDYFRIALESALNQTYRNIEIIIGDDSTNNETEEIVKKNYLNSYSNIKYYHNEKNIGQFDNDLKLYNMAKGEFINFLMDDDLLAATKIQKMMEYFIQDSNKEISLVTSHRAIIDDKENRKGIFGGTEKIFKHSTVIDGILLGNFMLKNNFNCIGEPTTALFRKEALKEPFGMFNGRRYGCNVDQASWLNLLSQNKTVFINDTLSCFRIHAGQQQKDFNILVKGFTDYVHQILTCREKGFLIDNHEYFGAAENCMELCKKHIVNPINQKKVTVNGHAEYEEFLKCFRKLQERYAELKKQTKGEASISKASPGPAEPSITNFNNNDVEDTKMKRLPLVTILIPAYNQTKYLKEALESAINQTYPNIEIIIGDDSTTNEVEKFVKPYLDNYDNIIYFKNNRTQMDYGVSNLEELFRKSSGEYINYLFHDDIFHVAKIEKMMKYFLNIENISLVTSHRQLIDENGKFLPDNGATKRIFKEDTLINGYKLSLICLENLTNFIGEPTTVLFKKSLITNGFGFINNRMYRKNIADLATWISLLTKGDAVYIAETLSYFRQHNSQNSLMKEIHLWGINEWKDIIDDSYKMNLIDSNFKYKKITSTWFHKFSYILNDIAYKDISLELRNKLHESFKNALDIIIRNENYLYKCPICDRYVEKFLPYEVHIPESIAKFDMIGSDVENFTCPHCLCHDRERHLLMYFNKLNLWNSIKNKKVLHIAPEIRFRQIIKQIGPEEYVQGDLYPTDESITKIDITNIPFDNEYFDLIICNHVLEHIEDDEKAMAELYRVLKKEGYAILQTPYSSVLEKSFEDESIKSRNQRLENFGQEDHVRIYGLDLFTRLKRVGFRLNIIKNDELFSKDECRKYGVNDRENLILVNKK